jgi:type III secretory pathway component EscT
LSGWADQILLLGVGTARIACAFVMLPLFANETVPALVRNSIFIGMGLVSLALQPPFDMTAVSATGWVAIFAKEAFVGLIIGFFFGSVLWSLEAAGQIIDTKVGATMAQIVDPLSGHQTSLNGAFLGRLANIVFIFSGGLSLIMRVLIDSDKVNTLSCWAKRLTRPSARSMMKSTVSTGAANSTASTIIRPNSASNKASPRGSSAGIGAAIGHRA